LNLTPFALSLSKGLPSDRREEGEDFDKLSPNGCELQTRGIRLQGAQSIPMVIRPALE